MVVTEEIDNVSDLGVFIYQLCVGKETFRLQRREKLIGEYFILNCYCLSGYEKETKGKGKIGEHLRINFCMIFYLKEESCHGNNKSSVNKGVC